MQKTDCRRRNTRKVVQDGLRTSTRLADDAMRSRRSTTIGDWIPDVKVHECVERSLGGEQKNWRTRTRTNNTNNDLGVTNLRQFVIQSIYITIYEPKQLRTGKIRQLALLALRNSTATSWLGYDLLWLQIPRSPVLLEYASFNIPGCQMTPLAR